MENHFRDGNFADASKIQYDTIPVIVQKIDSLNETLEHSRFVKLEVQPDDIAEIVSKWTGIPVQKMLGCEKEKLLKLESLFHNRVIGQDQALKKTADVIRMSKIGFSSSDKPLGSFLFMGKTGVGKLSWQKRFPKQFLMMKKHWYASI